MEAIVRICQECGSQVPEDEESCPKCGSKDIKKRSSAEYWAQNCKAAIESFFEFCHQAGPAGIVEHVKLDISCHVTELLHSKVPDL
ncbi:zinc-ribbon domain-containing protein [Methanobrevibacter sp.]